LKEKNNRMISPEQAEINFQKIGFEPNEPKWFVAFEDLLDRANPGPLAALLRSEPAPFSVQEFLAELLDPKEHMFPVLKLTKTSITARKVKTWEKMVKIGRKIAVLVSENSKDPFVHDKIVDAIVIEFEEKLNLSRPYLHRCYRLYMDDIEAKKLSIGEPNHTELNKDFLRRLYR